MDLEKIAIIIFFVVIFVFLMGIISSVVSYWVMAKIPASDFCERRGQILTDFNYGNLLNTAFAYGDYNGYLNIPTVECNHTMYQAILYRDTISCDKWHNCKTRWVVGCSLTYGC